MYHRSSSLEISQRKTDFEVLLEPSKSASDTNKQLPLISYPL